ncbi:MAG: hypothetical protein JWM72_2229 [Actinomycetia bacterium]|nr:hypothetical protein [Actinomycetes bacterium]
MPSSHLDACERGRKETRAVALLEATAADRDRHRSDKPVLNAHRDADLPTSYHPALGVHSAGCQLRIGCDRELEGELRGDARPFARLTTNVDHSAQGLDAVGEAHQTRTTRSIRSADAVVANREHEASVACSE